METIEFSQKKLSNRTTLSFGDSKLAFKFEDANHGAEFSVPYVDIPFERSQVTEKMVALKMLAVLFAVLGVFTLILALTVSGGALGGSIGQLAIAGAAYWGYQRADTTFTVMDTIAGRVLIIHDGQESEIIDQLEQRRVSALRSELADVDPANDPQQEARKFEWLLNHGVITEVEFNDRIAELEGRDEPGDSSPRILH